MMVDAEVTAAVQDELQLLTAEEVAALLACSTRHVYRMAGLGQLPAVRLGGMVRFRRADIAEAVS